MPNDTVPAGGEAVPMIYPDIQRRDGTLFFAVHEGNRKEISTSIERLIDMLDAMDGDPDLEETGDEHDTGMPEGWRTSRNSFVGGVSHFPLEDDEDGKDDEPLLGSPEKWRWHSQASWAQGHGAEGEEFSASGQAGIWSALRSRRDTHEDDEDTHDAEEDQSDHEPDFGWTNDINQSTCQITQAGYQVQDGEPSLGWCGHGRGFVVGVDSTEDTEANGDELDLNGDEKDFSGYPGEFDCCGGSDFDGSGTDSAVAMLRAMGVPIEAPEAWIPVSEPGTLFVKVRS